jgi:glucose-6-phosphate isomerase
MLREVEALVERRRHDADDVVVLGIGGSALGAIALRGALLPPFWNMRSSDFREGRPRLHVLDNIDPDAVNGLLQMLDFSRTLFIVISKSGTTVETMAQYLIVWHRLESELGPGAAHRVVFITGAGKGVLRAMALRDGVDALAVPANVGGRFSVLSPVGLFPAALAGVDVAALLRGAAGICARALSPDLFGNPSGVFAAVQWLADRELGARINVLMPYSEALRDLSAWFVQLWAESLGKVAASGANVGPTPVAAVGATDQHSQLQLYMEGPLDKTITFIGVREPHRNVVIPPVREGQTELAYLGGRSLAQLLDVERRATAAALASVGRPSMTISLPVVDAHHLGELIMMLQIATLIAGELYSVNAVDQPGVEVGKQYAQAIMGRPGSEEMLEAWRSLPSPDDATIV